MIDYLFVDSDIILDLLLAIMPFYVFAARLFSLAEKGQVKLFMSSLAFNNIDYILSKQFNREERKRILNQFKLLASILAVDEKIIHIALNSDFEDFEDAIQYYTATENSVPTIITRNLKDYKTAQIPVITAEAYLKANWHS